MSGWWTNQHPGRCVRCGGRIAAEAGSYRLVPVYEVQWKHVVGVGNRQAPLLEHHECREAFAGTNTHHTLHPPKGWAKIEHD